MVFPLVSLPLLLLSIIHFKFLCKVVPVSTAGHREAATRRRTSPPTWASPSLPAHRRRTPPLWSQSTGLSPVLHGSALQLSDLHGGVCTPVPFPQLAAPSPSALCPQVGSLWPAASLFLPCGWVLCSLIFVP